MNTYYSQVVLTYKLTKEENELLKKQHTEFEFEDVSNYFIDLPTHNPLAIIINPKKLLKHELELLVETYSDSYAPLFIFTKEITTIDFPPGFFCVVCNVSDKHEIAKQLRRHAEGAYFYYEDLKDYLNAKFDHESKRMDNAPQKRVELRVNTKMSGRDVTATASATDFIEQAATWGHKAIAITDKDVVHAFPEAHKAAKNKNIKVIYGVELLLLDDDNEHYITLLAKNVTGLKNLYQLISLSHTKYLKRSNKKPCVPLNILKAHREGLLLGTGCFGSILYTAIEDSFSEEIVCEIAKMYDYLELDVTGDETVNKTITRIGDSLKKPVVASGNTCFIEPTGEAARRIFFADQKREHLETEKQRYFRTTEEMLAEFKCLGENKAFEVVVTNTNLIADMIDDIQPIPDGFFSPTLDDPENEMIEICNARVKDIYEENLPRTVRERLDYELKCITDNNFSVFYMIARKLVKKSNEDGYLVGFRGGIGASLVAYLLEITGIDPIEYNIPFEGFAGLDGDKRPHIVLNFSNSYQAEIHNYVEKLFGTDKVFRAGTIGTMHKKTALSHVYEYFSSKNIIPFPWAIQTLATDIEGVKRVTGQHPGKLFIVPNHMGIYDFTPIQHPANNTEINILSTHFVYHELDDTLSGLNLLGHDDPTMIKRLEDLTDVRAKDISLEDEKTLNMLISADTLGVPEFESEFICDMIKITNPKTFDDLVKISGISHGTGVWQGNAQCLIKLGKATLSEVIAFRDEIMTYLMDKGIDRKTACTIMERVRTGKSLRDTDETIMSKVGVPRWYIESCNKIKYLFPKAHVVVYAMMAFRIAWFKAHYPAAFYKTYFEIKNCFDRTDFMSFDIEETKKLINKIVAKGVETSYKHKQMLQLLRVRLEMLERSVG